jgi:hypothetical protein
MYMSRLSGWLSSKPSKLPEMPEWLPSSTSREGPWARLSGMGCVPTCPHADAVLHHRYVAYQISVLGIRVRNKMSRIPNTADTPPPHPPDLDLDLDQVQDFELDPAPDPHQNNADLQPWAQLLFSLFLHYLIRNCFVKRTKK